MGFLGSLGSFLGPALTTATDAAGAYQGAEGQAAVTKRDSIIQSLMMQRQAQQFALQQALGQANIQKDQSEAYKNTREGGQLRLGDTGYSSALGDVEYQKALAVLPVEKQKMVAQGQITLDNALQEETARGNIQAGLQRAALANTNSQNALDRTLKTNLQQNQQTYDTTKQQTQLTGENTIRQNAIGAEGGNSLLTNIGRKIHLLPQPNIQPIVPAAGASAAAAQPNSTGNASNPQQSDWDIAASHLQTTQPGVDPATILGPRP